MISFHIFSYYFIRQMNERDLTHFIIFFKEIRTRLNIATSCYIKESQWKTKKNQVKHDNQKKCNHIFLHRKEFCESCLLLGSISRCSLQHIGTCKQISTRAPFYSSLFCWAWQLRCFLSELFWHQESNCCDLDTWMCDSSMAAILFKQLQSWRE